jgi:catechol 2,3-dioxygenase-like lactoylglutathione lyase family enzyme
MDLRLSHCFVTVHDHDAALAFYRDGLGLRVHTDVTGEGMRWLTLSPPSQPGLEIVLMHPQGGSGAADAGTLLALAAKGSLEGPIFATEDVDGDFEHLRAHGAEVLQEPIDQPYGVRDCAFRDPSGNMVRLSQRKS